MEIAAEYRLACPIKPGRNRWLAVILAKVTGAASCGSAPCQPPEALAQTSEAAAVAPSGPDPTGLLRAYLASTMDVVQRADALQSRVSAATLRPVALPALVAEVLASLDARVAAAGLRLHRDAPAQAAVMALSDDEGLRVALLHLVLRALAREPASGHVRLRMAMTDGLARIVILSGVPDLPSGQGGVEDVGLWAVERILACMGGALEREPRRAGYVPLSIVLRAPLPARVAFAA